MMMMFIVVTRCEHMLAPVHGSLNTSSATYGTTVMVSCDDGFMLPNGQQNITTTCQDGNWTELIGDCVGKSVMT